MQEGWTERDRRWITIKLGAYGRAISKPADERLQLRCHAACHGCLDDHVLQPAILAQQQLHRPVSHSGHCSMP